MIRHEFQLPNSVLENAKSFFMGRSNDFEEVRLSNKYKDMNIDILLEKSSKKTKIIDVYIGVTKGSSHPTTKVFEVNNILDLLKVYSLTFKEQLVLILIKFVPHGAKLEGRDYMLNKPLLEDGMRVLDISNYVYYISFNDKPELFYILYNLLLNEYFININPTNVRTDLDLIKLLIDKFKYFGYDKDFLLDNSHLESETTFTSSNMILNKLIFHVLNNVYNNKKCGLSILQLRNLFDSFYNLLEKESK